jgi:hypothetical protein
MAIEMKSISNYDYLRYMTAASREISDEPSFNLDKVFGFVCPMFARGSGWFAFYSLRWRSLLG